MEFTLWTTMTCVIYLVRQGFLLYRRVSSRHDSSPTLAEERANIIMDCFDLNGENNEYANANIRVKIFEIAGFMGVSMKEKFREEYDRWEEEMEQDVIKIE
jgi:hypothetical protein